MFLRGPTVCWALVVTKPILFLFPALPSCAFNCYNHPVSSDFSFSGFLPNNVFIFTVLQAVFSFPLSLAFTPQLYCHLLNCRPDLLFNRSNLIFTNSLQSLNQSFTFWPHFSPSCWLQVVTCSSQEPCCCLPSVPFALTLMVLFSDPHQVLSNPLFSPEAGLLWAHGPNLHTFSEETPRVNTSVTGLPGVSGSKLQTSPWSGFHKSQIKSQNH